MIKKALADLLDAESFAYRAGNALLADFLGVETVAEAEIAGALNTIALETTYTEDDVFVTRRK